jgi:hypothetical protein
VATARISPVSTETLRAVIAIHFHPQAADVIEGCAQSASMMASVRLNRFDQLSSILLQPVT